MKDVFKVVTDQILAQLDKGIIPWRRPWSTDAPTSYATNKEDVELTRVPLTGLAY